MDKSRTLLTGLLLLLMLIPIIFLCAFVPRKYNYVSPELITERTKSEVSSAQTDMTTTRVPSISFTFIWNHSTTDAIQEGLKYATNSNLNSEAENTNKKTTDATARITTIKNLHPSTDNNINFTAITTAPTTSNVPSMSNSSGVSTSNSEEENESKDFTEAITIIATNDRNHHITEHNINMTSITTDPTTSNLASTSNSSVPTGYDVAEESTDASMTTSHTSVTSTIVSMSRGTVGMKDGRIKTSQITASSSGGVDYMPEDGRLDSRGSWKVSSWSGGFGEWIQVDLIKATEVYGIITQGCVFTASHGVTQFKISYGPSVDQLQDVKDLNQRVKIFTAKPNGDFKTKNEFPQTVKGRYFRLVVLDFSDVAVVRLEYLCLMKTA